MSLDDMAQALGGHRSGRGWVVHCPAHDDRNPSLSIDCTEDGRVLVHCHAGCAKAAVIDALANRGLWETSRRASGRTSGRSMSLCNENTRYALDIWAASRRALGTPVERYLRSRAITIVPPQALRFHARLQHRSGISFPAMVALVTNAQTGKPEAIHRTYLDPENAAKANIAPNKMMLGPTRGGVIRLSEAVDFVMIGEGIESSLSVMQATGRPVWVALSASGMRVLKLPPHIKSVTLLADSDVAGLSAAEFAARRWKREGHRVSIARPPNGVDFNDLLTAKAVPALESAA